MSLKYPDILKKDFNNDNITIKEMKEFLKKIQSTNSFQEKDRYIERMKSFKKVVEFTWRDDQRNVIEQFLNFNKKYYVVHAIFGSGKTTLLLGMMIFSIINQIINPDEIMFISYNVSIKNEIKRRLKEYGISSKVTVRTFDSIIYEISKATDYPYINLPNFEGKRKHVYKLCYDNSEYKVNNKPKLIFIDECQDLERQTIEILNYFYPESKFVIAGDIFQSIQKEPRESMLWHFMKTYNKDDIYKIYMHETPRVPKNILCTLQHALKRYYPEFESQIDGWKSTNCISDADIEWRRLNSYTHIFEEIQTFCSEHKAEQTMILTFSSAITVKGNMGDIARLRRFLCTNEYKINLNHKKMEPENYFLSTANSSKGLERDYVICFLTFPLEKAFVNLSDDIVVNLITVALTRAKKKVIMYVPSYEDKFSRVLNLFKSCPQPNKQKIRNDKSLNDFTFQDYLDLEHCTTEIIKQSILKYDTRILLKEQIKPYHFQKIFINDTDDIKNIPRLITEEEKSFVGVFIENLITSNWLGYFPYLTQFKNIETNPMYSHCIKRIKTMIENYNKFKINANINDFESQFEGIYIYAQIHIAMSDKLFMDLSPNTKASLKRYWFTLKPKTNTLKPDKGNLNIQVNMKMPWVTGIADGILSENVKYTKDEKEMDTDNQTIIEIKASQDLDWKDDALTQSIIYALMSGKSWSKIHLINPFRNEKVCYHFNSKKIMTLRRLIIQDMLLWNTNCMLSKMYNNDLLINKKPEMNITDHLFLHFIKDEDDNIIQVNILQMLSPIKVELVYNSFVHPYELNDNKKLEKIYKLQLESSKTELQVINEVNDLLNNNIYKDKPIWMEEENNFLEFKENRDIKIYSSILDDKNAIEVFEGSRYNKNKELSYGLDISDALYCNIFFIHALSITRKLV